MEDALENSFTRLPTELIRDILSFCPVDDVAFVFPKVSRQFYSACRDSNLMRSLVRNYMQPELTNVSSNDFVPDDWNQCQRAAWRKRIVRSIHRTASQQPRPIDCWTKWAIVLTSTLNQEEEVAVDVTTFNAMLRLMQCLPHALLLGIRDCHQDYQHEWQMILIALHLFDVTGSPAYRSRLYDQGLNMSEISLRMAICLTVLVVEMTDVSVIFKRHDVLGGQSIADWLSNATIFSPDWWATKGRVRPDSKRSLNGRTFPFITVMFIATAIHHFVDRSSQRLPDVSKLPLFRAMDPAYWTTKLCNMTKRSISVVAPVPFDIIMNQRKLYGDVAPSDEKMNSFEAFIDKFHELSLMDDTESFFDGTWCIYYLVGSACDLRDMRFDDAVRGIRLEASRKEPYYWSLESKPFEDKIGVSVFTGAIRRTSEVYSVALQRTTEGHTVELQLHGQLSPFGISGGYYHTSQDDSAMTGGFFWLWKDQWARDDVDDF